MTPGIEGVTDVAGRVGIHGRYPGVVAELVRIRGVQERRTPDALNVVAFQRFRYDTGRSPSEVRAVIIGQPGAGCGGSHFTEGAAQMVQAGRGEVEFWTVHRREAGLQDATALFDAERSKNFDAAIDYYLGQHSSWPPLTTEGVPFMAHWGLATQIGDVEAILNLIPADRQPKNVFLLGHSQGGMFLSCFAGYEFVDGPAFERVAGLVFVDGGPALTTAERRPEWRWQRGVDDLVVGRVRRFGMDVGPRPFDPKVAVKRSIQLMMAFYDPDGESPFHPEMASFGGQEADDFKATLRLTNEAIAGFQLDDDPIPGSSLMPEYLTKMGVRCGRLDFPALGEPQVPWDLLNRAKVYGWLSGGIGHPGGESDDGPLNGYPVNQRDGWQPHPPNPSPTRTDAYALTGFFNGATDLWYPSARYNLDLASALKFEAAEVGITCRGDCTVPTLIYFMSGRSVFPAGSRQGWRDWISQTRIDDWTVVDGDGVEYSDPARERTSFPEGTSARLYNHGDFLLADNAAATDRMPGEVGAGLVPATLLPWVLARAQGVTPVPPPFSALM